MTTTAPPPPTGVECPICGQPDCSLSHIRERLTARTVWLLRWWALWTALGLIYAIAGGWMNP